MSRPFIVTPSEEIVIDPVIEATVPVDVRVTGLVMFRSPEYVPDAYIASPALALFNAVCRSETFPVSTTTSAAFATLPKNKKPHTKKAAVVNIATWVMCSPRNSVFIFLSLREPPADWAGVLRSQMLIDFFKRFEPLLLSSPDLSLRVRALTRPKTYLVYINPHSPNVNIDPSPSVDNKNPAGPWTGWWLNICLSIGRLPDSGPGPPPPDSEHPLAHWDGCLSTTQ